MSICFVKKLSEPVFSLVSRFLLLLVCFSVLSSLTGCRNPIDTSALSSFAKTDIDRIADTSLHELNHLMEELLVKLYKRNPRELDKKSGMSIGQRQSQIFDTPGRLIFKELNNQQGTAALDLAFNPDYQGDRVFALMTGMVGMVRSAYNWQSEQFMLDSLDGQKLFNSARNVEVLAWRLSNARDASGKLLLLTNSRSGEEENLSYERIFGKVIAIQDMMAFTVVGKWERGVNSVLKKVVFLPMGI
ncbi:MAG: hypothetical protein IH613_03215 [Desulfuromonadales bacterium]|nr:hypothetical protein [Desulfuromonadales bacterium]